MRSLLVTISALALSSSLAFAQTTPPAPPVGGDAPTAEQPTPPATTAPPAPETPPSPPAGNIATDEGPLEGIEDSEIIREIDDLTEGEPTMSPSDDAGFDADSMSNSENGATTGERRSRGDRMSRQDRRHHMRGERPRGGHGWRAMRGMHGMQGPEIKLEIDEDGGVKIEVKCGLREDVRACADVTKDLLDSAYSD